MTKLKQMVIAQEHQIHDQEHQIQTQEHQIASLTADYQQRIDTLQEQLRLAIANRYGRSSERYVDTNDRQSCLFDEAELDELSDQTEAVDDTAQAETAVAGHKRKANRGKRPSLPDYLPRIRIDHTLPDDQLLGPNGEIYEKIGEAISEQLDVIPATVQVIQHVRFKYAVKGREELGVKTAEMPAQPITKGLASSGLLAHVATAKYCHHLPLYRQEQIWSQLDVHLPRNSLCRWMLKMGEMVSPLVDFLMADMCMHNHMHADETPVNVISNQKQKANAQSHRHQGYMWCYTNCHGTVYQYGHGRGAQYPQKALEDFQGFLQCDAHKAYLSLQAEGKIQLVGCMAHARRKFGEVKKALGKKKKSPVADYVIKQIGKLYKIEAKAKTDQLDETQLYQLRQAEAVPILKGLHQYLIDKKSASPPNNLLGKAISYMLNQWQTIYRYTDSGLTCIDNNPVERKIRPFAIGRKNWMFHGSERHAKAAANLYSLIESAKMFDLNIFEYLKHIFEQLPQAKTPRQQEQLLPRYAVLHLNQSQ